MGASEEEWGRGVVSEGEDMKYNSWQRNFQHHLLLWIRSLFHEPVLKTWSFHASGTKMSTPCGSECNRIGNVALEENQQVF